MALNSCDGFFFIPVKSQPAPIATEKGCHGVGGRDKFEKTSENLASGKHVKAVPDGVQKLWSITISFLEARQHAGYTPNDPQDILNSRARVNVAAVDSCRRMSYFTGQTDGDKPFLGFPRPEPVLPVVDITMTLSALPPCS